MSPYFDALRLADFFAAGMPVLSFAIFRAVFFAIVLAFIHLSSRPRRVRCGTGHPCPQRKGVDARDKPARDEFDALLLELQPRFVDQLARKVELLGYENGEVRRPAALGLDALGAQPGDDLGARHRFGNRRTE